MLATAAGRLDATRAAANNYIIPVVSLLLGVGIRHEQVSPLSIVGAGVCLTGAWLIKPSSVRPEPAPATPAVVR
jgi:drug/metabolite transporter (DMT)-like permease